MRKGELIGNLILFSPLIIFSIASLSASLVIQSPKVYYYLSLILLLLGLIVLLKAKLPHFKKKRFITFGTKGMTRSNCIIYYIGGIFAGIGTILFLGLFLFALIKGA